MSDEITEKYNLINLLMNADDVQKSSHEDEENKPLQNEEKKTNITSIVLGGLLSAPALAVGLIQSVGFTSAGISAGSYAAGLMSSWAIAGGGATVAGGTVATLQSIGAVGLFGALGGTIPILTVVGVSSIGYGVVTNLASRQQNVKH